MLTELTLTFETSNVTTEVNFNMIRTEEASLSNSEEDFELQYVIHYILLQIKKIHSSLLYFCRRQG